MYPQTERCEAHFYLDDSGQEIERDAFLYYMREDDSALMLYVGGGFVPLSVAVLAENPSDAHSAFEDWARNTGRLDEINETPGTDEDEWGIYESFYEDIPRPVGYNLSQDDVDRIFERNQHQAHVILDLYKLVYDGSAPDRPDYDSIESLDGWPSVSEATNVYIGKRFIEFDHKHHLEVLAGGGWMNQGFSSFDVGDLPDWVVIPAPAKAKEVKDVQRHNVEGTPFKIGDVVKVVRATDCTQTPGWIGETGCVAYLEYDCGCGQSFPEIGVRFDNGAIDEFWKEELEWLCHAVRR